MKRNCLLLIQTKKCVVLLMGPRKGKEKKVDKAKVILCVFSHDHRYLISTLQGCFGISLTPGNIFYVKELKNVYYLLLCNLLTLTQSGNLGILKVCLCTSVEIGIFFNPLVTCLWNFISSVNIFGVLVVVVFFFYFLAPLLPPICVFIYLHCLDLFMIQNRNSDIW